MMKKVLIGFMSNARGSGITTYLMNVRSALQKENVKTDFLTSKPLDDAFVQELAEMGSDVYLITGMKHPVKQFRQMKKIMADHQYDAVYLNISEAFNSIGVLAAKAAHIKKIVVHSHSSGVDEENDLKRFIRRSIHELAKYTIMPMATDYYTCSLRAGQWLYPSWCVKSDHFRIINNAINIEKYRFNPEVRERVRAENGLTDKKVIGFVGNFAYVKRVDFIVEIGEELSRRSDQYVTLMAGNGKKFSRIKEMVAERKLENTVRLLGNRDDVSELMQAMDVLLLPSRFEGLPFVAIESQAAGLPTLLSDSISPETSISDLCEFVNVNGSVQEWADHAAACCERERKEAVLDTSKYCADAEELGRRFVQDFLKDI